MRARHVVLVCLLPLAAWAAEEAPTSDEAAAALRDARAKLMAQARGQTPPAPVAPPPDPLPAALDPVPPPRDPLPAALDPVAPQVTAPLAAPLPSTVVEPSKRLPPAQRSAGLRAALEEASPATEPSLAAPPSPAGAPSVAAPPSPAGAPSLADPPSRARAPSLAAPPSRARAPSLAALPSRARAPSLAAASSRVPAPSRVAAPSLAARPSPDAPPSHAAARPGPALTDTARRDAPRRDAAPREPAQRDAARGEPLLPERYFDAALGWSIVPPAGYALVSTGARTVWRGPGGLELLVESEAHPRGTPVGDWFDLHARYVRAHPHDYRVVEIARKTLGGRPGAVWEFTLGPVQKVDYATHAEDVGYAVMISGPKAALSRARAGLEEAAASFRLPRVRS